MVEEESIIPQGYKLVFRKKKGCPLCQRPELRGDPDEVIWSRRYNPLNIAQVLEQKIRAIFTPQEIMYHSKHFELIPVDEKVLAEEKKIMLEDVIGSEREMLEMNKLREGLEFDFDKDVDGKIKALSAEINELKLSGFDKDEFYLKKIKEYKSLCEMRYKRRDEIKEGSNVSFAVLEVRDLFNKMKELEETGKSEQPKK